MKLKTRQLNKIISDMSSREIDLILYLIKRQDSLGVVNGVIYDDIMEDMNMPRSSFYAAMKSLESKGFVHVSSANTNKGFDLFVHDNSFVRRSKDFKQGYVSINYDFIAGEDFMNLNVSVKKFFMRLLGLQAHKQAVKLLKDTVKQYNVYNKMDQLKELFDIEEVEGGYTFRIKQKVLEGKPTKVTNAKHLSYRQKVLSYCRNYNIDYTKQELIDTYKTLTTHAEKGRMNLIVKAFDKIIETRRLQPKLISYLGGMAWS